MALPSSPPISLTQIITEFALGSNLRAYLGCAPGVPTSGTLKQTDLLGKSAAEFHYGMPYTYTSADLGYYYNYVNNDDGTYYGSGPLNYWYGDNFGGKQPYDQSYLEMAIVNAGWDAESVYNAFTTSATFVVTDSINVFPSDANRGSSLWSYSDVYSSNAIYYYDYDRPYYNATYDFIVWGETFGYEYWMEFV